MTVKKTQMIFKKKQKKKLCVRMNKLFIYLFILIDLYH